MHASSWRTPSNVPPLDAGAIHVWCANTTMLTHGAPALASVLDADERARGQAYLGQADRARHIVTRGVLRTLAGRYLERPAVSLRFDAGPFGKPRLAAPDDERLRFNVSHSGDIVLLAFAREGHVGVDAEQWNPRLGEAERARIGQAVFSPTERGMLASYPSAEDRERAFYACWSRKEAYLKGTGAGISAGLSHVDVSLDAPARLLADRRDALRAARWALVDLDVGAGYSAALAFTPPSQLPALLLAPPHLFDP